MEERKIGKRVAGSVLLVILGIALLGFLFYMRHGSGGYEFHLYNDRPILFESTRHMGWEGYAGLLAFALLGFGCYGICQAIGEQWSRSHSAEGKIKEEKDFLCPYCGNRLREKSEYCPICGRKLS